MTDDPPTTPPRSTSGGCQFLYSFDQIGNRTTARNFRGGTTKTSVYTPNELNQYTSRTVPGEVFVTGTAVTNATVAVRLNTNNAASPAQRHGTYFWKALDADNSSAVYTTTNIQARAYMTSGTNSLVRLEAREAIVPKTPEYFEHDLDGNQTESGLYTNTWDANNRLVCVESKSTVPDAFRVRVDYQYDHQCRMFSRVVQSDYSGGTYQTTNTHVLIWDGWNTIGEIIDGTTSNWFTYGPDVSGTLDGAGGVGGLLIVTLDSTNDYLVAFDGNGNVMALIDADDGSVAGEYEYGPFNEPLKVDGEAAQDNPIRYSTQYWDTQTKILLYPLRPLKDGRWMCRDRIGIEGGPNEYSFVFNRSSVFIDPLGLACARTHTVPDAVWEGLADAWAKRRKKKLFRDKYVEHGGWVFRQKKTEQIEIVAVTGGVEGELYKTPQDMMKKVRMLDVATGTGEGVGKGPYALVGGYHTHPYSDQTDRLSFSPEDIEGVARETRGYAEYVLSGDCVFILQVDDEDKCRLCKDINRISPIFNKMRDRAFEMGRNISAATELGVLAVIKDCGFCYYRVCAEDAGWKTKEAALVFGHSIAQ